MLNDNSKVAWWSEDWRELIYLIRKAWQSCHEASPPPSQDIILQRPIGDILHLVPTTHKKYQTKCRRKRKIVLHTRYIFPSRRWSCGKRFSPQLAFVRCRYLIGSPKPDAVACSEEEKKFRMDWNAARCAACCKLGTRNVLEVRRGSLICLSIPIGPELMFKKWRVRLNFDVFRDIIFFGKIFFRPF